MSNSEEKNLEGDLIESQVLRVSEYSMSIKK